MQLFAIVANVGRDDSNTKEFVSQFLKEQLNQELVNEYLFVYDRFYNEQNKKRLKSIILDFHGVLPLIR